MAYYVKGGEAKGIKRRGGGHSEIWWNLLCCVKGFQWCFYCYYCVIWPKTQSREHHLDDFIQGQIIAKLEEVQSVASEAQEFGIAHIIVFRAWSAFQTMRTVVQAFNGSKTATKAEDWYIVLQLYEDGLQVRRPVRCVPLMPVHQRCWFL